MDLSVYMRQNEYLDEYVYLLSKDRPNIVLIHKELDIPISASENRFAILNIQYEELSAIMILPPGLVGECGLQRNYATPI